MIIFLPIIVPIIVGILEAFIPKKFSIIHKTMLVLTTLVNLVFIIRIFAGARFEGIVWRLDNLASLMVLGIGSFGLLIALYSLKYFSDKINFKEFSIYTLWTLGAACGAVLTNNFILLLTFWGFLGLTLYLLVNLSKGASAAAKKTFIIIGATDALMIMGIAIIWMSKNSWTISGIPLSVSEINILSFIFLALAALAKAGALPVHTWVPDVAGKASVPVTALLPASLDKLLGIYLLARIVSDIFIPNSFTVYFLLIIGALTVIVAVMMALIQHDSKRLLGYHAVSQVGYMVIGLGTGNPIGMLGGLFHMLNNAIYKSTLFLSSGAVEKQTGTSDLDQLGGLSKAMPITFISALIASMAISGIPPFNGFVSKWYIYQGLIQSFKESNSFVMLIVLLAAMIGSALTMASFIKLIHATFLTVSSKSRDNVKEVNWMMWLPMVILSGLCIVFGIFAYQVPLKYLIPVKAPAIGLWQPGLASLMVIIGLIAGLIIYFVFFAKFKARYDDAFIGGHDIDPKTAPSGTEFYNTISNIPVFKALYVKAEKKWFDIYDVTTKLVFFVSGLLSKLHSGILHGYLAWCLLGIILLIWMLK